MLLAGFVGSSLSRHRVDVRSVEAQPKEQREGSDTTAQRWEYCVITATYYRIRDQKYIGVADLCYPTDSGCRNEEIEFESSSEKAHLIVEREALAKAIAKLAKHNWEMVGQGHYVLLGAKTEALYFRRPKL
jgi:hypothetical protein